MTPPAAVQTVTQAARWAVVGTTSMSTWKDKHLGDRILRHLYEQGRDQHILTGDDCKVYAKGWSKTGDKKQCKGKKVMKKNNDS